MTAVDYSREKLGEMLVTAGVVSREQVQDSLEIQRKHGGKLGTTLVEQGALTEEQLADTLAEQKGLERIDLREYPVDRDAAALIPQRVARRSLILPVGYMDGRIVVAVADPLDLGAIDEVELRTGRKAQVLVATESQILQAVDKYMSSHDAFEDVVRASTSAQEAESAARPDDSIVTGGDVPVVRLVNQIIHEAVTDRASDIHFEPMAHDVVVRYRVDGVMHEVMRLPRSARAEITSRLKIISEMDIAERRRPQDGRIRVKIDGREIDFRVATLPTPHGESIVIRILNQDVTPLDLEDLGMGVDHLSVLESLLSRPYGAILVAGPTGSGKSTTMYAALKRINDPSRKIITIEEPIEYQMEGVTQIGVNNQIGLTFASGLRQILRSDPDVVMVGEIRDPETAETSIRAALTGHLVLSSIHTNDAPSALTRLVDMRVAPFITSSALLAVVSQRLARRLCPHCRQPVEIPADALAWLGVDAEEAAKAETFGPVGCDLCLGTGYRGRVGLFEVMVMDDELRKAFLREAPSDQLRALAIASGMRTLAQDALTKVARGETSLEEMSRVV